MAFPPTLTPTPLNVASMPQFYPPPYSLSAAAMRAVGPLPSTTKHHQLHSLAAAYPRPIDFRKDDTVCTNVLRHIVEWAKDLPVFADVSQNDKEEIVESSWFEMFILITTQHHLLPDLRKFLRGSLGGEKSIAVALRHLENQVEKWNALNCDHVELECLKAIVMYNAGSSERLVCRSTLERLQGDTMGSLQSYIKSHHVSHAARFGRLLMQLGELRWLKSEITKLDIFFPELLNQSGFISDVIKEELSRKATTTNYTSTTHFYKYDISRH